MNYGIVQAYRIYNSRKFGKTFVQFLFGVGHVTYNPHIFVEHKVTYFGSHYSPPLFHITPTSIKTLNNIKGLWKFFVSKVTVDENVHLFPSFDTSDLTNCFEEDINSCNRNNNSNNGNSNSNNGY
ncbi:hypothetical protein ACTA71_008054 [Dictyostelium dimigraforme]